MGKIIKSGIEYAGGGGGGGDVDKQYVDAQDAATLQSAKDYTDTQIGSIEVPTVVQATGQSTADVMSQKAVTDAIENVTDGYVQKEELYGGDSGASEYMIHIRPDGAGNSSNGDFYDSIILSDIDADDFGINGSKIIIGNHLDSDSNLGDGEEVVIGTYCKTTYSSTHLGSHTKAIGDDGSAARGSVLLGTSAIVDLTGKGPMPSTGKYSSVALGAGSVATDWDEISVGRDVYVDGSFTLPAFNRKITHVADGVANNDAATVGQLNTAIAGITPPTVVQTIGQSTGDVMSQKATTDMVFDAGDNSKVRIGKTSSVTTEDDIAIGSGAAAYGTKSGTVTSPGIAIGKNSKAAENGVTIGSLANSTYPGNYSINIGGRFVDSGSAIAQGVVIRGTMTGGRGTAIHGAATGTGSVSIGGTVSAGGGVAIGDSAATTANGSVAIGRYAKAQSTENYAPAIAIGENAVATPRSSVAIGNYAEPTRIGEVNIGVSSTRQQSKMGYNATYYRVIGGVHNGVEQHDAATVMQGNKLMTAAPTNTDEGVLGQLWTDTTAMHTYQCTAIDTTDPDNPVYTWTQRW